MNRRTLAFVALWAAAIAALVVIYFTQEPAPDPRRRTADGATVHDPDDRAPPAEIGAPPRAPEGGAPRQYRQDRRHTGRSPFVGPAAADVAWSYETGDHVSGQAVVGDDGTIYVGSHDHHVYAITREGTQRWRRDLRGPIYSTPALIGDRLFVGSDADYLSCLDAATGTIVWALHTEDDADTGIAIAPDGTLVFGAGRDVFAVSQDGEVRWRFRTGLKVFSAPAIDDDGTIYVGSQDDHLYAIAPDGRMRWRYHVNDDVDGTPAIGDDGTIYFGSDDHHLYALRRDGTLRFSTDLDGDIRAPVGLGLDGAVIVSVFPPRPRVISVDGETGAIRWEFPITTSDSGASVQSGALVDRDGNLYVGADDDFVYSLEPNGRMRWFAQTQANVDGEPILTPEGLLLVGSDDHRLYAIGARAGDAPPGAVEP